MVHSQPYPAKPIRIVTTEPGSGSDIVLRSIAQSLSASLGQQVIIDNRGIVAGEIVAKAPADGYTLLAYGSALWIAPLLRDSVPYDPLQDFAPVTVTVITPNVLVVHPSLPVKTVKELIALARARPGQLNYASSSTGATPHLTAELFKAMAGIDIVRIPFRGTGPALVALLGGQVQLMFPNAGAATPHVQSGRLRALAVTTSAPSALAPGLPTVAAAGLPGYESESPLAMFAPARTPATIIQRLNQEMARALNEPGARTRLFNSGMEAVGSTPEQLTATVRLDIAKWGKLIRDAGIRE